MTINFLTLVSGAGILMLTYLIITRTQALKEPPPPDIEERRWRSYQRHGLFGAWFMIIFLILFFGWTLTFPATLARQP